MATALFNLSVYYGTEFHNMGGGGEEIKLF